MKDLILGTANFGMAYGASRRTGSLSFQEIENILLAAERHKIVFLDTAIAYGNAEHILGKIGVSKFKVISKISSLRFESHVKDYVVKSVEEACTRLGIDALEGLLIHDPKDLEGQNREEVHEALNYAKEQGLIHRIGASIYSPNDLHWNDFDWNLDIVQVPINVFDSRFETTDFLKTALNNGIEIQARSIFLQGCLLSDIDYLNKYFYKWLDYFKLLAMHAGKSKSKVQMCVVHANSFIELSSCVFGVSSSKQLDEIVAAMLLTPQQAPESLRINEDEICDPRKWQLEF